MMNNYRYTLEPYKTLKSRYTCPECFERKKFTRYLDNETGQHLADHVGRCDRLDSCGYHYTPKQYFDANPNLVQTNAKPVKQKPAIIKPDTIPKKLAEKTFKRYHKNNFVRYLDTLFDAEVVRRLIDDYHIGTSKHWPGATVFWQVDQKEKIRTGKIMLYDALTGKRVKQPYPHIAWAHSLLGSGNGAEGCVSGSATGNTPLATTKYNLQQCFFGEHTLAFSQTKIVAIVESEKTAIIAAGFMPEHLWLAAGSLEGITYQKCKVLNGREVMLFPDIDGYAKWEEKMKELKLKLPGTRFGIARYLQDLSPDEQTPGMDIADWLVGVRSF